MSEPSSEPRQGRISRWRARSRGTKTMKAGYALAARDVKNWDRDVLARIGSSRMTPSHLQRLAQTAVNAQNGGPQFADVAQRQGQAATNRMLRTQRQQAPTRNPLRQAARGVSRWRDVRHGRKMVKAAMVLAVKEAKNADPNVRLAIGNDPSMTRTQIANTVQGRMEQVFRPEVYGARQQGQQAPGQQLQGQGQGQQLQGQQGQQVQGQRLQGQQLQQGAGPVSAVQQLAATAQQIGTSGLGETEQALVQAMAEFQRLQSEIKQLIETRMAQIQQENANLSALYNQVQQSGPQVNQQTNQQLDPNLHNVGQHPIVRTDEGPQQPGADQQQLAENPEGQQVAEGPQAGEDPQVAEGAQVGDGPQVAEGAQVGDGPQVAEGAQVGDGPQVAEGAQVGDGPQVAEGAQVGDDPQVGGEQQVGGGAQAPVAGSGEQQVGQGDREGGQPQVDAAGQHAVRAGQQPGRGEVWSGIAEDPEGNTQANGGDPQGQQAVTDPKQLAAKEQAALAAHAAGDVAPPQPSSAEDAAKTANAGRQDPAAQRTGQGASRSTKDSGRSN
ncbi:hypothetical protein OHA18_06280 [Kribbella sp. NBC_00709]|uniref:hypothetical protein n=1 Tax=Kribbella sp. NBC_00709 TaxID=2975972 RepID=UPI002E2DA4E8|nr:hypothetical protein [Kribbella sp. NBC_00709]